MTEHEERFDAWAIVEQMGHRAKAGRLTEETRGGRVVFRLDVPDDPEYSIAGFTSYFSSYYEITLVSEAVARAFNRQRPPAAVHVYGVGLHLKSAEEAKGTVPRAAIAGTPVDARSIDDELVDEYEFDDDD